MDFSGKWAEKLDAISCYLKNDENDISHCPEQNKREGI
jgi:hypothetical protein